MPDRRPRRYARGGRRSVLYRTGAERAPAGRDAGDAWSFHLDAPHSGSAYERFIPRNEMDIAVVGAASWVKLSAGRGSDRGGASRPGSRRARRPSSPGRRASGWPVSPSPKRRFAHAGELARKAASPISDMRGTAEFRLHLVGVLTQPDSGQGDRAGARLSSAALAREMEECFRVQEDSCHHDGQSANRSSSSASRGRACWKCSATPSA